MGSARVLIIANPMAGTVTPALVWSLTRVCREHAERVSVQWTTAAGDATRIATKAAESGTVSAVVSVGGDGTAREVAAGLATAWHGTVPMLIVPGGTANSWYHTMFGSTPWPEVVAAALPAPAVRRLDLARVAGRLVFAGASAGFSARGIHEARALTTQVGPGRYQAALVNLIPRYRPYPGRVLVDGTVVHSGPTALVNVGGSRYRGGHFELLPDSVPDDGLLDVCVLGGEHSLTEMMSLTRTGSHLAVPGVVYARGRRVVVERTDEQPLWFEHDGEVLPLGPSSYAVEVVPSAVPVLTTDVSLSLAA